MVNNDKKKRNKTTTEFIGFSAFQTEPQPQSFTPSSIYTSTLQDTTQTQELQTILKKLSKKDSTTKYRALQQLQELIVSLPKKEVVAITSYLLYLFETKLSVDNSRQVRYEVLKTFVTIKECIPKAFIQFLQNKCVGLVYIMTCDTASEVKKEALRLIGTNEALYKDYIVQFITFVLKNVHGPSNVALITNSNECEECEERYERVVLSTLYATSQLLSNTYTSFDIALVNKQLQNSTQFRKAGYTVILTLLQHNNINTVQMLYTSLEYEKDKSNIILLLQWLLLCLKHHTVDVKKVHAKVSTIFAKGCYGSTASEWACMVLPIIALLYPSTKSVLKNEDDLNEILLLLKSLDKGKQFSREVAYIECSIVEVCYYIFKIPILKHTVSSSFTTQLIEILSKYQSYFSNSLKFYLNNAIGKHELGITISREISKLNLLSGSTDILFHYIQSSFWSEITGCMVNASVPSQLSILLQYLKKETIVNQFIPCLTGIAQSIITTKSPTVESVTLLTTILETNTVIIDLKRFLNDLLSWMVLDNNDCYFNILKYVLMHLDDTNCFESFLKELVSTSSNIVSVVTKCIQIMVSRESLQKYLPSKTINEYAQVVFNEYLTNQDQDYQEYVDTILPVLPNEMIVDWINLLTIENTHDCSLYLKPLLKHCIKHNMDQVIVLGIQAWVWGGNDSWLFFSTNLVHSQHLKKFLYKAITMLRNELKGVKETNWNVIDETHWIFCAHRLLSLLENTEIILEETSPINIMTLFSFDQESTWDNSMYAYHCFIHLLQDYTIDSLNIYIASNIGLLSNILLSISSPSLYWKPHDKVMFQKQVDQLFTLLSNDLLNPVIQDIIQYCSNSNEKYKALHALDYLLQKNKSKLTPFQMKQRIQQEKTKRQQALLFTNDTYYQRIDQHSVKKGDTLYYHQNISSGAISFAECSIVKVHDDNYPNLYYTVLLDGNERQTIPSKLYCKVSDENVSTSESLFDTEDRKRMEVFSTEIYKLIVEPLWLQIKNDNLFHNTTTLDILSTSLDVLISKCLIFESLQELQHPNPESTFTKVQSILQSYQEQLNKSLLYSSQEKYAPLLLKFSSITNGNSNSYIMHVDAMATFQTIYQYYSRAFLVKKSSTEFHCFVLSWIGSCLESIQIESAEREDVGIQLLDVLYKIVLNTQGESELENSMVYCEDSYYFTSKKQTSYLILSIYNKVINLFDCEQKENDQEIDKEQEDDNETLKSPLGCIAQELIPQFVNLWDMEEINTDMLTLEEQEDLSCPWFQPFMSLLNIPSLAQDLAIGAIPYAQALVSMLFSIDLQHRWCAYQLLTLIAFTFRKNKDASLIQWPAMERANIISSSLIKEEIEELEQDIKVTSSWLPSSIMTEIEKWSSPTTTSEEIDGRFLTWLLCLDFLEDAASVDLAYRGSISSYIQATSAVDIILSLAVGAISFKIKESDKLNYNSTISSIAKHVLLRTAQTLPTLFKTWWKDTCPRSAQMNVSTHVQESIAPDILKMELKRINSATSGMVGISVSGSCVSREVTAVYEKDECQLSVTIRIPPLFPLRNVEVDCHKTLGVPEKRWKHWQLQIMLMLNNQDGSILDALYLWKENVDKEFEGVEPCPVCYSVICVKTHAMPNLQCKTCNNRFHTTCLYKWFHSSGKNQCVLCQQPWNGFRV